MDKSEWVCRVCNVFEKTNVRSDRGGVLCQKHAVYCGKCDDAFTKEEISKCDWCLTKRCKACGPLPNDCINKVRPHV